VNESKSRGSTPVNVGEMWKIRKILKEKFKMLACIEQNIS
jgi:hypothetical protein